jgi:hypothetical protein
MSVRLSSAETSRPWNAAIWKIRKGVGRRWAGGNALRYEYLISHFSIDDKESDESAVQHSMAMHSVLKRFVHLLHPTCRREQLWDMAV